MTVGFRGRLFVSLLSGLARCAPANGARSSVPSPAGTEAEIFTIGKRNHDPTVAESIDPTEARTLLAELYPRHLSELARCPPSSHEPATWSEIDAVQRANVAAGRFVPVVEQRIAGSFTAPGQREVLFVVRVTNCQSNMFIHRDFAIVPAMIATPRIRWTERRPASEQGRIVATIERAGRAPSFLELRADRVRLVALNRAYEPRAAFAASAGEVDGEGRPAFEPWIVEDEWRRNSAECLAFYLSRGSRVRSEIVSCPDGVRRGRGAGE